MFVARAIVVEMVKICTSRPFQRPLTQVSVLVVEIGIIILKATVLILTKNSSCKPNKFQFHGLPSSVILHNHKTQHQVNAIKPIDLLFLIQICFVKFWYMNNLNRKYLREMNTLSNGLSLRAQADETITATEDMTM